MTYEQDNNDIVEFFKAYDFPTEFIESIEELSTHGADTLSIKMFLNGYYEKNDKGENINFIVYDSGEDVIPVNLTIANNLSLDEAVKLTDEAVKLTGDPFLNLFENDNMPDVKPVTHYGFTSDEHFTRKITELQDILDILGNGDNHD